MRTNNEQSEASVGEEDGEEPANCRKAPEAP